MEAMLIEEIRKRPYLYNTKSDNYRDLTIKDNGWAEISRILNLNCIFIKQRWKKLRDCYRQALSRRFMTAGGRGKCWRPWRFEKQMEFIAPFMSTRAVSSSNASPERKEEEYHSDQLVFEEKQDISHEDAQDYPPVNAQEEHQEDYRENIQEISQGDETLRDFHEEEETWPKKRKRGPTDFDKLLKYLHEKKKARDQQDDLDLFFSSACKSTKKLPRKFQNRIKKELLDSIVRAEEQFESDMSCASTVPPVPSACFAVSYD